MTSHLLTVVCLSVLVADAQYTYESTERQCIFNYNAGKDHDISDKLEKIDRKLNSVINSSSGGDHGRQVQGKMKTQEQWEEKLMELEKRLENLENKVSQSTVTGKPSCPHNFTRFAGHCYYFSTAPLSWFAAGADCISKGAHLVSVETPQEDLFLLQIIRSTKANDLPMGYWTGGTNMVINQTWVWAHSGEPLTYSRFHVEGDSHDGYYALELHKKNPMRAWDDTQPHIEMAYICEMELD